MKIRECQIGMQGPKRSLAQSLVIFANYLDMATSRMAFLDLNLHVLQFATHRYCYSNPILLKYHAPKAKDSTNRSNVFRDRNIQ